MRFATPGYRAIPITPHHHVVEGETAYATVMDYPGAIDMATVYVPADVGEQIVESLAQKGITDVWFNPGRRCAVACVAKARALGLRPIRGLQHPRNWQEPVAVLIYNHADHNDPYKRQASLHPAVSRRDRIVFRPAFHTPLQLEEAHRSAS